MQKRLSGSYTTRVVTNDTFRIELEEFDKSSGRWLGCDFINFPSAGSRVRTPKGYDETTDGAYAYAAAQFGTTTRK